MLAALPRDFDIVCTHPMFGPDSGSGSWSGLPLVFDRVRVGRSASRQRRADAFLRFFEREGCRMVEMACEEHDRLSAGTQFVTHTVGRVLGEMQLAPTPIDTRGYESLLSLVGNTANDSFDLYYGLFMYNQVRKGSELLFSGFSRGRERTRGRGRECSSLCSLRRFSDPLFLFPSSSLSANTNTRTPPRSSSASSAPSTTSRRRCSAGCTARCGRRCLTPA